MAGQTFTVNQLAAACGAFSLSPISQNVGAAGGSVSVTVTGTTGCARTATSNASWITVTAGASGTGSGTVSLSVAANALGTARTGLVTVGGKTFSVLQAAAACSYTLSATSALAAAAGSSSTVGVTATTGCTWTASSNVAWITLTAGTSGTGNGTVGYTVAAKPGGNLADGCHHGRRSHADHHADGGLMRLFALPELGICPCRGCDWEFHADDSDRVHLIGFQQCLLDHADWRRHGIGVAHRDV